MAKTVKQCLDELRQIRATLSSLVEDDPKARSEISREARQLILDTETAKEQAFRTSLNTVIEATAMTIGANMGVFELLVKSKEPLSAQDIAKSCGSDDLFASRILRTLACLGAIQQEAGASQPLYSASSSTRKWMAPHASNTMRTAFEYLTPALVELPEVLREQSHTNIETVHNGTFARAFNMPDPKATAWDVLVEKGFVREFGYAMEFYGSINRNWLDFYPFEERVLKGYSGGKDDILMVDVAGLTGVQSLNVQRRFPGAKGRFIVEDMQSAIAPENAKDLEYINYDFFTPQPQEVHGARCYFMRWVTHDWSQDAVIKICSNVRKAMKPGYSKLIIHDYIVSEENPHQIMLTLDMVLMTSGGEERTLARHRDYIEKSGLKITGVYEAGDGVSLAIIECEVA